MVVVTVVVYPLDEREEEREGGGGMEGVWTGYVVEEGARVPRSRIYYFVTKPFLAL